MEVGVKPWARAAADAVKRAAATEAGRKAIQRAAAAGAAFAASGGGKPVADWRSARKQRDLAYKLARQVHGQLSEAVFLDSDRTHLVVWKDDVPLAAFPPVRGDLAERPELQHVTADDRFDPPPARPKKRLR